ncbi:helix-turn-helix transcriptional regulator [Halobellus rufus]|uniref:helix-turn-helix transcriptional regulator n=1 Tax=Halobellus rufus TaxID=1448860 RepID=UPI0006784CB5|nr:helix-turn-helix domain-containing protein [Halobellus rufus]
MSARDDIAFLAGSEIRVDVLRALQTGPTRPSELSDRCGCARETAQRAVGAFVERGWAEKESTEEGYCLTRAGELVVDSYETFEQCMVVSNRYRTLLQNLGTTTGEIDCGTLAETRYTEATAENPHAPLDRFLSVVGDAPVEEFYGITPIVSRVFNRAAGRVIGDDTEVQLIVDSDVLSTSAEEYPDALERADELGGFTLYVSEPPLESGLMIVDGHAYLGAYDDQGNLVASADSTDDEFVSWGERTFAEVRDRAETWL